MGALALVVRPHTGFCSLVFKYFLHPDSFLGDNTFLSLLGGNLISIVYKMDMVNCDTQTTMNPTPNLGTPMWLPLQQSLSSFIYILNFCLIILGFISKIFFSM